MTTHVGGQFILTTRTGKGFCRGGGVDLSSALNTIKTIVSPSQRYNYKWLLAINFVPLLFSFSNPALYFGLCELAAWFYLSWGSQCQAWCPGSFPSSLKATFHSLQLRLCTIPLPTYPTCGTLRAGIYGQKRISTSWQYTHCHTLKC